MSPEPYNEEIAANVLQHVANGRVFSEICNEWDADVPSHPATIELWAAQDAAFAARLIEAKRIGALVMVADCQRIATDRLLTVTERKLLIDTKMRISALWNADCNPKSVVEQTTTVRNLTSRDEYIELAVLCGMTRTQAEAEYRRQTGATVQ